MESKQAHPIHLWDAVTAELRCSYLGYDDKDEVDAAFSLAFSSDGAQLAAGGNKLLRLFDTATPGRKYTAIKTHAKTHPGQPGGDLTSSSLIRALGAESLLFQRVLEACSVCDW